MYRKLLLTMHVLVMCIVFLSSCVTQKACDRKFPPTDSFSVIYRDTIICEYDTVYVPYQELSFDTTGMLPPTIVYHHSVKKSGLTASVDIKNGKLTVLCKEDSLKLVLEHERKFKLKDELKVEVPKSKEVPMWYDIWLIILLILSLLGNVFLLIAWRMK